MPAEKSLHDILFSMRLLLVALAVTFGVAQILHLLSLCRIVAVADMWPVLAETAMLAAKRRYRKVCRFEEASFRYRHFRAVNGRESQDDAYNSAGD